MLSRRRNLIVLVKLLLTPEKFRTFIDKVTAESCWEAIRMAWINVLSGAPDFIKVDAGIQFRSKGFKGSAKASGVQVEIVPTEVHHKIRCINDTAGFEGTVPTPLVFGTYPRLDFPPRKNISN
eukprot:IDg14060t1